MRDKRSTQSPFWGMVILSGWLWVCWWAVKDLWREHVRNQAMVEATTASTRHFTDSILQAVAKRNDSLRKAGKPIPDQ